MGRIDLTEFEALVIKMRALGVLHYEAGDVKITLGDVPLPPGSEKKQRDDEGDMGWPEGDGDVYKDPFSFRRGVPNLVRDTER